jgi:hypothetical protein
LRTVGVYKTSASSPSDLSYLYDSAAAPLVRLVTLSYPSPPGAPTLTTFAHSTFGNQVVGSYDTQLQTGNAFIYDIKSGAYTTNNAPGAVSTTAYGVWANKIAGGYAQLGPGGGPGFERGYVPMTEHRCVDDLQPSRRAGHAFRGHHRRRPRGGIQSGCRLARPGG